MTIRTNADTTTGPAALQFVGWIHPFQLEGDFSNYYGIAFKLFIRIAKWTIQAMRMRCAGWKQYLNVVSYRIGRFYKPEQ